MSKEFKEFERGFEQLTECKDMFISQLLVLSRLLINLATNFA